LPGFNSHTVIHTVRGFAYPASLLRMSEGLIKLNELFYSASNLIDRAVAAHPGTKVSHLVQG